MSLQDCPYCHTVPYVQAYGAPGLEKSWQVICPDCQMAAPMVPNENAAITYWNSIATVWPRRVFFKRAMSDAKDED